MAQQSLGERTEKPTSKKWKDARKKGQVVRSRDLAVAASSLAVTIAVIYLGGGAVARLAGRVADGFLRLGDSPLAVVTPDQMALVVLRDSGLMLLVAGPFLLAGAVVGVATNVFQAGWVFAPEALAFNWEKLSPTHGLKRLKPMNSGMDLLKGVIGVTVVAVIAYNISREFVEASPALSWMDPTEGARTGWSQVVRLLWQTGLAGLLLAGADYGLQRWRIYSSLKMSKQEVRDELKSNEGNPENKARVRRIQRDMNRRRMLASVPRATVVVTNPTHYAVALEYRRDQMVAPVVVAKGRDHLAARIKAIAREHGVPTVENVSLAQALYKGTEVGDVIPADLFSAVAEVLAYLVRIKQLML